MTDFGEEQGAIDPTESRIVKNLFGLPETLATHAATPRTVVFALPAVTTVAEFVQDHADSPFSRVPIFGDSRDDVTGFVLRVEILKAHADGRTEAPLGEFQRPIHTLPDTENLANLFETMFSGRIHIAAIINEFGSFSGIITLKDVIETILGHEIVDEADTIEDMQQKARDLWKKRAAKMGLRDDQS